MNNYMITFQGPLTPPLISYEVKAYGPSEAERKAWEWLYASLEGLRATTYTLESITKGVQE